MSSLMRLIPGLIAAAAALLAMKLVSILGFVSQTLEIIIFFVVYLVVAVFAHRAMLRYNRPK